MLQLSPSPRANILAFVAIFVILSAVGAIVIAGQQQALRSGPRVLAVAPEGDEVYVGVDNRLYRVDTDGSPLSSAPLATLGISLQYSDLVVGPDAVWVADPEPGALMRCDRNLSTCDRGLALPREVQGRVIHLALHPSGGFFVVGGARDRVAWIGRDGTLEGIVNAPGGWNAPNTVEVLADGRLAVADANHHRLVLVGPESGEAETQIIKVFTDLSRPGRRWPVAARQARDNSIWSINGDGMLEMGDVLVYSLDGTVRRRIELDAAADPIALAHFGEGMLIADFGGGVLYRVDAEGNVSSFGSGALAQTLEEVRIYRSQWAATADAGWAALVFGGLLVVISALLDKRARREPASTERRIGQVRHPEQVTRSAWISPERAIRPDREGVIWLGPSTRFRRMIQLAGFVLPVPLFGALGLLIAELGSLRQFSWVVLMSVAVVVPLVYAALRVPGVRIGSNGRRLYVRDLFGRERNAPLEEVIFTGRRFLIGSVAVPAQQGTNTPFDDEQYKAYVRPLEPTMKHVGEFRLSWEQLRAGRPAAWAQLLFAVGGAGLLVWAEFF